MKTITDFPDAPDIESSTRDYAERFAGEVGQWLLEQQVEATREAFHRLLPGKRGLKVLDVGGGHGQNIKLMRDLGHELTVFSSQGAPTEMIESSLGEGAITLDTGKLLSLPYEDHSFDAVICYRIISHMDSWETLIGELSRVTRMLVLVDYPSMRSVNCISGILFVVKKQIEKNTRRYGVFHDYQIDREFLGHGWRLGYRQRQFFAPMAFYRAVGKVKFCRLASKTFRKLGLTKVFGSPVIAGYRSSGEKRAGVGC